MRFLMVETLILKIRRRDTAFYSTLYDFAKRVRKFELPVITLLLARLGFELFGSSSC